LVERAYKQVLQFSVENEVAQIEKIYDDLLLKKIRGR
jgi:hypothetical protein